MDGVDDMDVMDEMDRCDRVDMVDVVDLLGCEVFGRVWFRTCGICWDSLVEGSCVVGACAAPRGGFLKTLSA